MIDPCKPERLNGPGAVRHNLPYDGAGAMRGPLRRILPPCLAGTLPTLTLPSGDVDRTAPPCGCLKRDIIGLFHQPLAQVPDRTYINQTSVPEPWTLGLFITGLLLLAIIKKAFPR